MDLVLTVTKPTGNARREVNASPHGAKPAPVSSGKSRSGQRTRDLPRHEREKLPDVFAGNVLLERSDLHMLILPHHKNKCSKDPGYKALRSKGVSSSTCLSC